MRCHWSEATYLLETLLLKINAAVKKSSEIELSFTIGPAIGPVKVLNETKTDRIIDIMNRSSPRPGGGTRTHMGTALARIFESCFAGSKPEPYGFQWSKFIPFTLFILTDFVWAAQVDKGEVLRAIGAFT